MLSGLLGLTAVLVTPNTLEIVVLPVARMGLAPTVAAARVCTESTVPPVGVGVLKVIGSNKPSNLVPGALPFAVLMALISYHWFTPAPLLA